MLKKIATSGFFWVWVAVLLLVVDRYSKVWAITHLSYAESLEILPVFNLTLAYNTGAAFSFLHSASGWQNWIFGGLAVFVSGMILVTLSRLKAREWWMAIALCLILAGAIGNAIDRMLYGYVIDFLDFHWGEAHFAIFNIADSAICVGAFMLIVNWMKKPSAS